MITREEYDTAVAERDAAAKIISTYHQEQDAAARDRFKRFRKGEFYTLDELLFSAGARCRCGAGLAYPKQCASDHRSWFCSAYLTGSAHQGQHDEFPFAFYEIKSENQPSAAGQTTRPVQPAPAPA